MISLTCEYSFSPSTRCYKVLTYQPGPRIFHHQPSLYVHKTASLRPDPAVWPILHAPTFMTIYSSPSARKSPSFVVLVLSICCLSSRYIQDPRLASVDANGTTTASRLLSFAKETIHSVAAERSDLEVVQALFNMSVVQEGTARPNQLWVYLSQAVRWVGCVECTEKVRAMEQADGWTAWRLSLDYIDGWTNGVPSQRWILK